MLAAPVCGVLALMLCGAAAQGPLPLPPVVGTLVPGAPVVPAGGGAGDAGPAADGAAPAATGVPAPTPQPRPTTAAQAQTQLDHVQREAEALTEQWHTAQDDLAARQAALTKLQAAVAPARSALDAARADEERYRREVADGVAMATFESGKLDQLDALLAAQSPQEFLDQMSALETISAQDKDDLDVLVGKVDYTSSAKAAADDAVARAQAALDQANKAEQDLAARKHDADARTAEADRLLLALSPAERRAREANGLPAPLIIGSGLGVQALRMAATQVGKPYVWGGTGPNSYDCSGLVYWAFKRLGITLPRSAAQQATVGTPVAWNDLRPGDLVFYYNPIGHVGIYAGNGTFLDAPQSGDVVKYQKVEPSVFTTARRM